MATKREKELDLEQQNWEEDQDRKVKFLVETENSSFQTDSDMDDYKINGFNKEKGFKG